MNASRTPFGPGRGSFRRRPVVALAIAIVLGASALVVLSAQETKTLEVPGAP